MQEIRVQSLGWEDSLEEEMATHFSALAGNIPWTEKHMGSQSQTQLGNEHTQHRGPHTVKLKFNISRTSSESQELKPKGMVTVSTSLGRSGKSLPAATYSIRERVGLGSMQTLAGSIVDHY